MNWPPGCGEAGRLKESVKKDVKGMEKKCSFHFMCEVQTGQMNEQCRKKFRRNSNEWIYLGIREV